jgi:putative selenium metabolism hydrolase
MGNRIKRQKEVNMDPLAQRIGELSETYRDYSAENLSRLVKLRSPSGREKEVALELQRQMQAAGFDEARIDPLGNVIGRVGFGPRVLAIDAHIDTVDVGNPENWDFPPFCGEIRDGHVLGRGTVDQKGGAAAMVTAGRILKETGFDRDLSVYFTGTVMEEDCDGLCWKYILEQGDLKPELVVITEPTALGLYRGHRGRMEINVSFHGISAHGSAPERGDNAIYMASRACLEIDKLNQRLKVDEFLGKGSATVSEFISASPSLCAVSDFAKIHIDRRLTWGETKESAMAEVDAVSKGRKVKGEVLHYRGRAFTGLEYGMEKYFPTWRLEESHPAVQLGASCHRELFGEAPRLGRWDFSTNATVITGLFNIPAIGFGPGNEVLAHSPNEKIPVSDLVRAAAFYAMLASRF